MDYAIEENFVCTFCEKRAVDRLLYELKSKDKRMEGIYRFGHHTMFIKQNLIVASSNKYTSEELIREIRKLSKSKTCYILAPYEHAAGVSYPLEEGIREGFYYGFATVFIIDKDTAVIKDEQCYGSPMKYILHRSRA